MWVTQTAQIVAHPSLLAMWDNDIKIQMSLSCRVSFASSHVENSSLKSFPDQISFVLWIKLRTTSVCIFFPLFFTLCCNFLFSVFKRRIAEGGLWKENKLWNWNLQPRKTTDRDPSLLALAHLPVRYQPAATLLLPNLQLKASGASNAALWPDLTLAELHDKTCLPYFPTLSRFV